jgi:hypothetical protein
MNATETIAAARAAIAQKAAKYTPKQTVHWIIWEDEAGNGEEYEGMGYYQNLASDSPIEEGDYFCQDCIEGVVAALNDDPDAERPEGFAQFSFRQHDMPEEENFAICAKCGHHIDCTILWSEQEMDTWLDPKQSSDEWLMDALGDPAVCWELSQLLDEHCGAGDDFPAETLEIAKRVLACQSECALLGTIDLLKTLSHD